MVLDGPLRSRLAALLFGAIVPLGLIVVPPRVIPHLLPRGDLPFLLVWVPVVAGGAAVLAARGDTSAGDALSFLLTGLLLAVVAVAAALGTGPVLLTLAALAAVLAGIGTAVGAVAGDRLTTGDRPVSRSAVLAAAVTTVGLAVALRVGFSLGYWLGFGARLDSVVAIAVSGIGIVAGGLLAFGLTVPLRVLLPVVAALPLALVLVTAAIPPVGSIGTESEILFSIPVAAATGAGALVGAALSRRVDSTDDAGI